jgi:hypothetical protein
MMNLSITRRNIRPEAQKTKQFSNSQLLLVVKMISMSVWSEAVSLINTSKGLERKIKADESHSEIKAVKLGGVLSHPFFKSKGKIKRPGGHFTGLCFTPFPSPRQFPVQSPVPSPQFPIQANLSLFLRMYQPLLSHCSDSLISIMEIEFWRLVVTSTICDPNHFKLIG